MEKFAAVQVGAPIQSALNYTPGIAANTILSLLWKKSIMQSQMPPAPAHCAALDVLVIGGVGIDTIVKVPALPLPNQDSVHVPARCMYQGALAGAYAVTRAGTHEDFLSADGLCLLSRHQPNS